MLLMTPFWDVFEIERKSLPAPSRPLICSTALSLNSNRQFHFRDAQAEVKHPSFVVSDSRFVNSAIVYAAPTAFSAVKLAKV